MIGQTHPLNSRLSGRQLIRRYVSGRRNRAPVARGSGFLCLGSLPRRNDMFQEEKRRTCWSGLPWEEDAYMLQLPPLPQLEHEEPDEVVDRGFCGSTVNPI